MGRSLGLLIALAFSSSEGLADSQIDAIAGLNRNLQIYNLSLFIEMADSQLPEALKEEIKAEVALLTKSTGAPQLSDHLKSLLIQNPLASRYFFQPPTPQGRILQHVVEPFLSSEKGISSQRKNQISSCRSERVTLDSLRHLPSPLYPTLFYIADRLPDPLIQLVAQSGTEPILTSLGPEEAAQWLKVKQKNSQLFRVRTRRGSPQRELLLAFDQIKKHWQLVVTGVVGEDQRQHLAYQFAHGSQFKSIQMQRCTLSEDVLSHKLHKVDIAIVGYQGTVNQWLAAQGAKKLDEAIKNKPGNPTLWNLNQVKIVTLANGYGDEIKGDELFTGTGSLPRFGRVVAEKL